MVMSKVKYEALREKRMEENKRRMEELNLPLLSKALENSPSKSYPMKKTNPKPRVSRTELVPVRRSERFFKKPAPQYKEVTVHERVHLPRRLTYGNRTSNRGTTSVEAREIAITKAEELESSLGSDYPIFVKPMLPSHVSGGFWLGLPSYVCKSNLPKSDGIMSLIDEQEEEWEVIYLARKSGLSGGWKRFAIDHDLVDGDALVFQLVRSTAFKVFIIRVEDSLKSD